ncbi:MAG: hypothetical protein M1821_006415 [Bathelium mastoideum]|nr:MAG: hypothetical protein M1821_006415 [Bathelium mastoideum]KAI9693692.1 MAG: hypothetical protein M1822_002963 [Bathelium mastoideum]
MASTSNPPKISLSLGAKKPKAQPRPQLGKRPRSALQDEPEDEEPSTEPQTITGFENGTSIAVDDKPKQGPRIIAALKNRDFGDEARRKRQRSGLPTGGQGQTAEPAAGSDDGEPKQYGLIMNRTKHDDAETENVQAQEDVVTDGPSRAKTEDELAMDALTGKKSSSTRTIPVNEDEVYHEDMGQVPEAPNQATYASMPVDDFGKALLAGMGWKEGQAVGRRNRGKAEAEQRDVQRRPEQLGLGAKEDALLRAESGADRKARRKGVQNIYNPVVLRNKATGEAYTEEELKAKQEQQKLELSNGNKGRDDSRERNYDRRRDDRNKRRDAGRDYKHGDRDSGRNERDRRRRHADGDESYSKSRSSHIGVVIERKEVYQEKIDKGIAIDPKKIEVTGNKDYKNRTEV